MKKSVFLTVMHGLLICTQHAAWAQTARPPASPAHLIDALPESAIHMQDDRNASDKNQQKTNTQKAIPIIDYRASHAAARAYLGDETNTTSIYSQERKRSEITLQLTTCLMQMGRALDKMENDLDKNREMDQAFSTAADLIGKGQAQWLLDRLREWQSAKSCPGNATAKATKTNTTLLDAQVQITALTEQALRNDQRINNLKAQLGIHNTNPSAPERTLSVAGYAPIIFSPLAKLAQVGVEKANGGTRSERLQQVVALGMALDDRSALLSRLAGLIISARIEADRDDNQTLGRLASDLQKHLAGKTIGPGSDK